MCRHAHVLLLEYVDHISQDNIKYKMIVGHIVKLDSYYMKKSHHCWLQSQVITSTNIKL